MIKLEEMGDIGTLAAVEVLQEEGANAKQAAEDIIRAFETGSYKTEQLSWIPEGEEFTELKTSITLALELKLNGDKRQTQQWSNVRNRVEGLTTGALKKLNTAFSSKGH